MEVDMPWEEGVGGEEDMGEEDEDEGIDEVERLLRQSMVEGEEEVPSSLTLPHDSTMD